MSGSIGSGAIGLLGIGVGAIGVPPYAITFTSAADLLRFALKAAGVLGVGQSALAEDYADAFTSLNGMIAQWNRQRYLIWHLRSHYVVSDGSESYTVGTGEDFDVDRPDRIEAAFYRQYTGGNQPVDYPLSILESREDYNRIALKSMGTFPKYVFYDAEFPTGNVYFWPVPPANSNRMYITLKHSLSQFQTYDDQIAMPPEYAEALWTNLCIRLAPLYQYPVRPEVVAMAKASLAVIRGANAQIPRLVMPPTLRRTGRFNVMDGFPY